MIVGQSPRIVWRQNAGGQTRSIAEAIAIARRHGVFIPDDVDFFEVDVDEMPENTFARGPRVDRASDAIVYWSALVHDKTGKVPFLIRSDVLTSDEAIVALFAHEMYELKLLRPLLQAGKLTMDGFINLTRPGVPGNFHDEAWDEADRMVAKMREVEGNDETTD